MHLYLVRHGQSYVNLPDWDWRNESWDQPLTDLGRTQADAAGKWLAKNIRASHLYASTLKRTQETAELINKHVGLTIQSEPLIREVGTNAPDGTPFSDALKHRYQDGLWGTQQPYDALTKDGENWMQFRTRVGVFIESLLRRFDNHGPTDPNAIADQSFFVVCHGGVIEAFYEYVFEKGPWSVVSVITRNTGITHLEYKPVHNRPAWRLHYHNRLEHLTPELIS